MSHPTMVESGMGHAALRLVIEPRHNAERREAAAILRDARQRLAAGLDASDACGWAMTLLPESRAAQRLTLDWLIRSGQIEHALTLTSGTLLRRRHDWRIWLRRAEALLLDDRPHDAREAIDRALEMRPRHRRAVLLAAEIARRCNDTDRELSLLRQAALEHAADSGIAQRLIEALLRAGEVAQAAAALERLPESPIELQARVLAAQGRLLDAREALERELERELEQRQERESAADDAQREPLMLELIHVLRETGDWPALRSLLDRNGLSAVAASRLAETCLEMGAFDEASRLLQRMQDRSEIRDLLPRMLLEALRGRRDDALDLLARLRAQRRSCDVAAETSLWLRGLLGLVASEQTDACSARRAGADPAPSVLDRLVPQAAATLHEALRQNPLAPQAAHWRLLKQACDAAHMRRQPADASHALQPEFSLDDRFAPMRQAA